MTELEYNEKIKAIEDRAEASKKELALQFCKDNNHVKIGDRITDHSGMIEVEKISYTMYGGNGYPCCIYEGLIITKNGQISKLNNNRRKVYQSNLIVK